MKRPPTKDQDEDAAPLKEEFPMRINKYLAHQGVATRREADVLIKRGIVSINGVKAELGSKVKEGDEVVVSNVSGQQKKYYYYAYHKPVGVVTHSPQVGEKDVVSSSGLKHVFPIGRLDKASHGLMILTNDGRITDKLLNPEGSHEKEYIVTTVSPLRPSFKENMEKGVDLGEFITKPCKVRVTGEKTFNIILTEGKRHQIRRMCEAMHNDVRQLERVRIMNVRLENLKPNTFRKIEGRELETFLANL
jgi:23S rRNA pseudouridine2604 synthase